MQEKIPTIIRTHHSDSGGEFQLRVHQLSQICQDFQVPLFPTRTKHKLNLKAS